MPRRFILFAGIFLLAGAVFAREEVWEGNAAVVSEGVFEVPGLYAASNAFPEGTTIRVENPRTGKAVSVKVIRRIEDNANLFILLSQEAAALIGLSKGDVDRVKTTLAPEALAAIPTAIDELVENPDPDINPIAKLPSLDEASKPLAERQVAAAEEPEAVSPLEPEEEVSPGQVEEVLEEVIAEAEEAVAAEGEPADEAVEVEAERADEEEEEVEPPPAKTEAEILAEEAAAGTPQENLFQEPKEIAEAPAAETEVLEEAGVPEEAEQQEISEAEVQAEAAAPPREPEGPFPSLEPPSPDQEVLAFSEIKPVPPEKEQEDRPIASMEPPRAEETEEIFQALGPDAPQGEPPEMTPPEAGEQVLAFSEITPVPPAEEAITGEAAAEATMGGEEAVEAAAETTAEAEEITEAKPEVSEALAQPDEGETADLATTVEPDFPLVAASPQGPSHPEGFAAEDSLLFLVPPEYLVEGELEPASPDQREGEGAFLMAEAAVPAEAEESAAEEEAFAEEQIAEVAVVEEVDEYPPVAPEELDSDLPSELETVTVEEPDVTEGRAGAEERPDLVLVPSEPKPPSDESELAAATAAAAAAEPLSERPAEPLAEAPEAAAVEPLSEMPEEAEAAVVAAAKPLGVGAFEVSHLPADRKEGRTYFIQLGAYKSETLAIKVEDAYSERYPVAVLASASDTGAIYRVFIGPLSQDESGTLLRWFQAKGFRDAFLRSAN